MRRVSILFALAVLACGERPPPSRSAPPDPVAPSPVAAAEVLPASREVTFVTRDGVTISATLQPAATPDAPAVILVHQLSSTRAEWRPLLDRLRAEPALTTLAIDMRGHGASTSSRSGPLDWHSFDTAQWEATRLDVVAAAEFLASADSRVSPRAIAAAGASIGSTAVITAVADGAHLRPLVALSPGRAYHGIDVITPAMTLHDCPVLGVASMLETDAADTANALGRLTNTPAYVTEASGHGVVLFATDPNTLDHVEDFLRSQLAAARRIPRAPRAERPPPPVTSTGTHAP